LAKDSRKYYENFDWESAELKEKLQEKIDLILSSIPNDVKSMIDIGCGDGTISNKLKNYYKVTAVDRSINALKFLETSKICASADKIPIKSQSFDLVFSSEMIEHLPDAIFYDAINEFKRITKKYIYLTFPNNENVEKNFVKCPDCGTVFNKIYHLRKLNLDIIKNLFPEFEVVFKTEHGLKIRYYNKVIAKIKHSIVSSDSWIPLRWTPENKRNTTCPDCGKHFKIPYKFSILGFLLDSLNIILSPKKPYQLFVLLKKKNA